MPGGIDEESDEDEGGSPVSTADKLKKVMIKKKGEGTQAIKIFKKFPDYFSGTMSKAGFQKGEDVQSTRKEPVVSSNLTL